MKQNNNIINQVNNRLTKMNNGVRKTVQKDIVMNTLRVLIIIYTAFVVPQLKQNQLDVTKNQLVRFIIIAVIVYLSFIDVVSAILLTIALLVTIHRTGSDASQNNNNSNRNNRINNVAPIESNNVKNNVPVQSLEEAVAEALAEPEVVAAINTEQQEPNENGVNGANANVNGVNAHNNAHNNANVNGVNNNVNGVNANVNGVNANAHVNATNAANAHATNNANVNGVNDPSMELFVDAPSNINNINLGVTNLGNNVPVANDNSSVSNLSVFDASNNAPKNNIINNASNNNSLIDQLNSEQPASETLTDNILRAQVSNNNSNDPVGLTTGDDLHAIQENAVPGGDLLHEVKTFQEQHSAQSLGNPMGVGAKRYKGHHHQNEKHPNLKHDMLRNENL